MPNGKKISELPHYHEGDFNKAVQNRVMFPLAENTTLTAKISAADIDRYMNQKITSALSGMAEQDDLDNLNRRVTSIEYDISNISNSLGNYIRTSEKGVADGVATLDEDGKVPLEQLPDYDNTEFREQLSQLQSLISALNGAIIYLGNIVYTKEQIKANTDLLTEWCQEQGKFPPQIGYCIVDDNSNDWVWNGSEWIDIGYYEVAKATNNSLGVVQGNDVDLGVVVDSNGKMSVKNLQSKLDEKVSSVQKINGTPYGTGDITIPVGISNINNIAAGGDLTGNYPNPTIPGLSKITNLLNNNLIFEGNWAFSSSGVLSNSNARIISIPTDKTQSSDGYVGWLGTNTSGTLIWPNIAGLGTTQSIAGGTTITIPVWTAIIGRHNRGAAFGAVTFYALIWNQTSAAELLQPGDVVICVRFGDSDHSDLLMLGNGQIIGRNSQLRRGLLSPTGTQTDYVRGDGSVATMPTIPTSFPPSGTATGDLSGTYPGPNVIKLSPFLQGVSASSGQQKIGTFSIPAQTNNNSCSATFLVKYRTQRPRFIHVVIAQWGNAISMFTLDSSAFPNVYFAYKRSPTNAGSGVATNIEIGYFYPDNIWAFMKVVLINFSADEGAWSWTPTTSSSINTWADGTSISAGTLIVAQPIIPNITLEGSTNRLIRGDGTLGFSPVMETIAETDLDRTDLVPVGESRMFKINSLQKYGEYSTSGTNRGSAIVEVSCFSTTLITQTAYFITRYTSTDSDVMRRSLSSQYGNVSWSSWRMLLTNQPTQAGRIAMFDSSHGELTGLNLSSYAGQLVKVDNNGSLTGTGFTNVSIGKGNQYPVSNNTFDKDNHIYALTSNINLTNYYGFNNYYIGMVYTFYTDYANVGSASSCKITFFGQNQGVHGGGIVEMPTGCQGQSLSIMLIGSAGYGAFVVV